MPEYPLHKQKEFEMSVIALVVGLVGGYYVGTRPGETIVEKVKGIFTKN